jgi:hypothetical protein
VAHRRQRAFCPQTEDRSGDIILAAGGLPGSGFVSKVWSFPASAEGLILAGLRHLEELVDQEARKMPIYIDIRENKVLGPAYERGHREGLREGLQEGELKGELTVLRRQIEKRFGTIPGWAEERLAGRSATGLEDLSVRVLDAQSIEDLLK